MDNRKKRPDKDGFYLVTTKTGKVRQARYYKAYDRFMDRDNVIAWSEMPEGYKEND